MKTRVITGSLIFAGVLVFVVFYPTVLTNLLLAVLSMLGVWEAHRAAGLFEEHRPVTAASLLFGLVPFVTPPASGDLPVKTGIFLLIIFVFLYTLRRHAVYTVREAGVELAFGILIPLAFSVPLRLRDLYGAPKALPYLILILGSAWLTDTGAYFIGTLFGRHKLCPEISPKKTLEGLLGGLLVAMLGNMGLSALLAVLSRGGAGFLTVPLSPRYGAVLACTFLASLVGVLGDLSFSVIKRCYGIKDYSHLLPGHGGILDRFDSVLFIAPAVSLISQFFPMF